MRKAVVYALSGAFVAGTMLWLATPPAKAIKAFKDQFEAKYVKKETKDAKEKAFAEAVAKAKCNVCHEGKKKSDRNAYGKELAKLLDKKADKDNIEKIKKSLEKVAKAKVDPKDKKSPTFGELIKEGKLPGGDPEAKKKEEKKA
jgi:cytochrome c2